MQKNIYEIFTEVKLLNPKVARVLSLSDFYYYDDLSGVEIDSTDPDQLFLLDELQRIFSDLDSVSQRLTYLSQPIKTEGKLLKQSNGRYAVNGVELTSGCSVEYLSDHAGYEPHQTRWKSSRIEHNGSDYYIVGGSFSLNGITVRIR